VHENDSAPHFAPLFELLQAVVRTRDYSNPAVAERVAEGAVAARAAGIRPEVMLAYLRRRLNEAPLSAVGDWYRSVLIERVITHATLAYFDVPDNGGDTSTPP
jgi:hypothetical protein